jgi:hypothetical protein|tara:strand:- start:1883 stop:2350 length:468 start_codon:yes stop_codon:yes gene_type:complete
VKNNSGIIFHFYSSKAWVPVIKVKTNCEFDHMASEIPGVGIYESTVLKGVTKSFTHSREPIISMGLPFYKESKKGVEYIKFLDNQVGKGFDLKAAIFGFWGYKCESDDKWYCSELGDTYFPRYLGEGSHIKTTIEPKVLIAKIDSFLLGLSEKEK